MLGSPLGGTLAQLAGYPAMIATNAAIIFGGAVYVALVAVRYRLSMQKRLARAGGD